MATSLPCAWPLTGSGSRSIWRGSARQPARKGRGETGRPPYCASGLGVLSRRGSRRRPPTAWCSRGCRDGPGRMPPPPRCCDDHLNSPCHQAGIMVLLDAETWLKAGIELSDGEALLGSVLTTGRSDWATGPFRGDPTDAWI